MHRHRHFNLRLHDDHELAALLHDEIVERVTLHEWPLSCVQRITTADGRRAIYKAQYGPTVESEFYAAARSELLVSVGTVYRTEGHVCMLMEFVEGPRLADLDLPAADVVRVGQAVLGQIAHIKGDLPHCVNVSSRKKWTTLTESMLADLRGLVERGKFSLVSGAVLDDLARTAFSPSVLDAVDRPPGYVHWDLGGDNLFVLPDGYRVIDWQRPLLGPPDLDLAILLESLGHDPWQRVDHGIVRLMYLLRIHWLTQCALRWFPQGTSGYDAQVARLSTAMDGPSPERSGRPGG